MHYLSFSDLLPTVGIFMIRYEMIFVYMVRHFNKSIVYFAVSIASIVSIVPNILPLQRSLPTNKINKEIFNIFHVD